MTRRELEHRYEMLRRNINNMAISPTHVQMESERLLEEAMRHLNGAGKVSIDIETNYINPLDKVTGDIKMAANPKNKFYVGRPTLLSNNDSGYCKATEKEAIEHARALCEETGIPQVVVKMVAIVERQKPPVKVTKVK